MISGFNVVSIGRTMCIITHGKFASIFDIIQQQWVNHIEFEDEIITLFRHYKNAKDRYQSVILRNGAVYVGVLDYDTYTEPVPTSKRTTKIDEEIIRVNEDIENNAVLFVTVKQLDKYYLKGMYRSNFYDLGEEIGAKDGGEANLSATTL